MAAPESKVTYTKAEVKEDSPLLKYDLLSEEDPMRKLL